MPQQRRSWLARLGFKREPLPTPKTGTWALIPSTAPDVTPIDTPREQLASAVGWVAAASMLLSEDVRVAQWGVWRQTGESREDWAEAPKHPAALAIGRPNPTQTLADVLEITDLHFSLTGQWFWHLVRARPGGPAIGLEIIYPQWVQEPTFADGRHTGWRVAVPGYAPKVLPVEDVVWGRRPHPADPWKALSQVEATAASHYADLYTRAYAYSVMRNDGGIPAGILSSDQDLTTDQADAIQARWRQRYSQAHGEVAVLGAGSKWQSIGIPMQDLKFLEMGDFNREQILAMFRVPPAVMGQSKDFNRANADAAMVAYQRQALQPRLRRYEDALNRFVLPALGGDGLYLEFADPVDKDRATEQQLALNDLKAGVLTVNEYRDAVDLDPIADGDVYLIPAGVSIRADLAPDPTAGDDADKVDADSAFAARIAHTDDLAKDLNDARDLGISWAHIITGSAATTAPGAYLAAAGAGVKTDEPTDAAPPQTPPQLPPVEGEEKEVVEDEPRSLISVTERLELTALRAKAKRLETEAARDRWYRNFRATVAKWMSEARAAGYPSDWTPPTNELPTAPLPDRGNRTVIEYLEHLKGPGGKELACRAIPD